MTFVYKTRQLDSGGYSDNLSLTKLSSVLLLEICLSNYKACSPSFIPVWSILCRCAAKFYTSLVILNSSVS